MKDLIFINILAASLIGLALAALPSIYDCARLECFNDLLHLKKSIDSLASHCASGDFKDGTTGTEVSARLLTSNPKCGTKGEGSEPTVILSPDDYRPVCECLDVASIPKHCNNLPSYQEVLESQGSLGQLFRRCKSGDLSVEKTAKDRTSREISPSKYRPVCDCLNARAASYQPATDEVLRQQEGLKRVYIDVFLHIVTATKKSPRAQKFHSPGAIEKEFSQLFGHFEAAEIQFLIKGIDLTINAKWALGEDNARMRQSLYMGDNRDLNIYLVDDAKPPYSRPINRETKVYCTVPFGSPRWRYWQLGEPHQDGCLVAGPNPNYEALAVAIQGWMIEDKDGGAHNLDLTKDGIKKTHDGLAKNRLVPLDGSATSVGSSIEAEEIAKTHCQVIPCYRELLHIQGSLGRFRSQCETGRLSINERIEVKRPGFSFMTTCGSWPTSLRIHIQPHEFRPVCDCLTHSTTRHWPAIKPVFVKGLLAGPIMIDVFIHVLAASEMSLAARRFRRKTDIISVFRRSTGYYQRPNIRFSLKLVDLTINAVWAQGGDDARMRQTLHRGDRRDLNIYYLEAPSLHGDDVKVFCTFPFSASWSALSGSDPEHDGCLVSADAAPWEIATQVEPWFGIYDIMQSSCPDCGPSFDEDDIAFIRGRAALNRFVPVRSKWSRLRLLQTQSIGI